MVGKRKKMYFSVISFQEFLNFPIWVFQKTSNVSSEYSFEKTYIINYNDVNFNA